MIELSNNTGFSVQAKVRSHTLVSDVLAGQGGQDLGMNPHEILESALAACTSLTLKMYAQRKGFDLQDVKVEVNTVAEGAQSVLSRKIELIGNLKPEEKTRLREIADKCPIHRLLTSQVTITTESL